MKRSNSVFHYCSIDTFIEIIKNRTLRLSDLNKTNDYMEKKWTAELLKKKESQDLLQEELKKFNINMNLTENSYYNEVEKILYSNRPVLISCFSKKKDLLSQWRAYGKDGEGISIGFNYKELKKLNEDKERKISIQIRDVVYKESKQKEILARLMDECILYMKNMFKKDVSQSEEYFSRYFISNVSVFYDLFINYLGEVSCMLKNPSFSEEKEIRLIYDPKLPRKSEERDFSQEEIDEYFKVVKEKNNFLIGPIQYRRKHNQLVAFSDLEFSKLLDKNIINEIVVGPKANIYEDDIYGFLLSQGYDANNIKISYSNATYR